MCCSSRQKARQSHQKEVVYKEQDCPPADHHVLLIIPIDQSNLLPTFTLNTSLLPRMLQTLLVAGLVGLTAALPAPQNIEFAAVDALPPPTRLGAPNAASVAFEIPTYTPSTVTVDASTASKKRTLAARDACDARPIGQGIPNTYPDDAEDFVNNIQYSNLAVDSYVPQGYELVFQNLNAATQQSGYLGFYTLNGYDTIACRQQCDATATCTAFNTYIERDPVVEPGDGCSNPNSTAVAKCALYGLPISADTATNSGQFQEDFQIVIAGSNGECGRPLFP